MCNQQFHPLRKQIGVPVIDRIGKTDKIDEIYDTQAVGAGASQIDFFPPQPSGSKITQNYQSNPLPGDYSRKVFGVALNATVSSIRSTDLTSLDPDALLNSLREGALEITADEDESLLARIDVQAIMDFRNASVEHSIAADATDTVTAALEYHTLSLPAQGVQLLPNPFRIGNGQVFQANLKFEDGSGFPDPANYLDKALNLKLTLLTAKE